MEDEKVKRVSESSVSLEYALNVASAIARFTNFVIVSFLRNHVPNLDDFLVEIKKIIAMESKMRSVSISRK